MARLACYLAAMAAVLFALQKLLGLFAPSWGEHLGGWVAFLVFLSACPVFHPRLPLAEATNSVAAAQPPDRDLRVHRRDSGRAAGLHGIHHALRVGGAVCGLCGDLGNSSQLSSLEAANAAVSNELAARLERGDNPAAESLAGLQEARPGLGTAASVRLVRRQAAAVVQCIQWHGADATEFLPRPSSATLSVIAAHCTCVSSPPFRLGSTQSYGGYQRAVRPEIWSGKLRPIWAKSQFLLPAHRVAANTPEARPRAVHRAAHVSHVNPPNRQGSIAINSAGKAPVQPGAVSTLLRGGQSAALPTGSLDLEIPLAGASLSVVDWKTGKAGLGAVVRVRTRPSVLVRPLVRGAGRVCSGRGIHPAGRGDFLRHH